MSENGTIGIRHTMPDNGQKKKHRMEENGTEKENAALKYRERNEEKLRADARSTERRRNYFNKSRRVCFSLMRDSLL